MANFGQSDPSVVPGNPYVAAPQINPYSNNPQQVQAYYTQIAQSVPAQQVSYAKRRMLKWLVPERGTVEMYINPQSIRIEQSKLIRPERTKGGWTIQYWGEELIQITINGHTGSSGIEGINILDSVYRSEQIAFDIIAIEELSKYQETDDDFLNMLLPQVGTFMDVLSGLQDGPKNTVLAIPKPTLGYYATTVEMYWQGEVYRGFFTKLSVSESVDPLGIFPYDISFTATQKRGIRRNYLPWQHTPTAGPSDHNTVPYTYDARTLPTSNSNDDTYKQLGKEQAIKQAQAFNL
jgi:hypothetical protein